MLARSTYSILLTGLALAACAPMPPQAPLDTKAWTRCATDRPGARCDVQVVEDSSGPYSCALGRFRVEPDALELTGRRPVNIQWAVPRGYGFCDGDGGTLKSGFEKAQRDVYTILGSDDKSGIAACIEALRLLRETGTPHRPVTDPGSTHAYEIRFSDRNGRTCTIDPWIRNG